MADIDEKYKNVLKNTKIPILILDNKWHQLFQSEKKTVQIKRLEQELKKLLQKQSKLNTDTKALHIVKKDVAKEILEHIEDAASDDQKIIKKQEKRQKTLNELDEKQKDMSEEMNQTILRIDHVNRQLMIESMDLCYKKMKKNDSELSDTEEIIAQLKESLKSKLWEKDQLETENEQMYSYMHDILGPGVVEVFDKKYTE